MERKNPWLSQTLEPDAEGTSSDEVASVTPGPQLPQGSVPAPEMADRLPVVEQTSTAPLWIVGAHGGSGETSLAAANPTWRAAGHCWPKSGDESTSVVLVARSSVTGLQAARRAAIQWAAGEASPVELLGLVVMADAPGRLPRSLRDLLQLVGGGVPRLWRIPWIDAWRVESAPFSEVHPTLKHTVTELEALTRQDVQSNTH